MKLVLIFLLAIALHAGDGEKKRYHIHKDLTHLDLSHAQKESLKGMLKKFQHEIEELRAFKEKINAQKQALFLEEKLDTEALTKLNFALYEKSAHEENKMLSRMHQFLTKEQRAQFIRYFEEWTIQ